MNAKELKKVKREEAEERQARYDALSRAEKVQLVWGRPGDSIRELERLHAQ